METTSLPVYKIETCEDIDYKTIFNEVAVGESFVVQCRGVSSICNRIGEWDVSIPSENCHVSVNPGKYNWRSSS